MVSISITVLQPIVISIAVGERNLLLEADLVAIDLVAFEHEATQLRLDTVLAVANKRMEHDTVEVKAAGAGPPIALQSFVPVRSVFRSPLERVFSTVCSTVLGLLFFYLQRLFVNLDKWVIGSALNPNIEPIVHHEHTAACRVDFLDFLCPFELSTVQTFTSP